MHTQKELAKKLGLSPGRVSEVLSAGTIGKAKRESWLKAVKGHKGPVADAVRALSVKKSLKPGPKKTTLTQRELAKRLGITPQRLCMILAEGVINENLRDSWVKAVKGRDDPLAEAVRALGVKSYKYPGRDPASLQLVKDLAAAMGVSYKAVYAWSYALRLPFDIDAQIREWCKANGTPYLLQWIHQ